MKAARLMVFSVVCSDGFKKAGADAAGGVPKLLHVMLACKVELQHTSLAAQGVRLNKADLMHSIGGDLEEFAVLLRNLCCKPVVASDGERAGKLQLQTGFAKL